jgi:hypothetical protein
MFCYYSRYESGHRSEYMSFLESEFSARRVGLISCIFEKSLVLFLMIEERPLLFFLICILRRLAGKKTAGLLFRVRPLINDDRLKYRVKRILLSFLVRFNIGRVMSIVHESVEPGVKEFTSGSFMDFQFWDLRMDGSLFEDNNEHTLDNCIALIGRQDSEKGFDIAVGTIGRNEFHDYKVILRGSVSAEFKSLIVNLPDGSDVVDSYVDETEIIDAYRRCSLVWCCYSPMYDQSSGVLGRSFQFGRTPIVRADSISEVVCKYLGSPYVSLVLEGNEVVGCKHQSGILLNSEDFINMKNEFIEVLFG